MRYASTGASRIRTRSAQQPASTPARPDLARHPRAPADIVEDIRCTYLRLTQEELLVLVKVFPITLKPGKQAEVEAIVEEFAPKGPRSRARCRFGSTATRPGPTTCCSSSTSPTRPPTT